MPIDQRAALERLIKDRREDYAGLSRLLGRNAAYIQQFIKRGIPKKLDERDRHILARYFGVDDAELGGPPRPASADGLMPVPQLDVRASAGVGAINENERETAKIGFDERWLRQLARGGAGQISMIQVTGDSMVPTLADGDDILVDQGDAAAELRDGIYVLRLNDTLMVKRLARSPAGGTVTIKSDNPNYPTWADVDPATVDIIGRVIWLGHRLR